MVMMFLSGPLYHWLSFRDREEQAWQLAEAPLWASGRSLTCRARTLLSPFVCLWLVLIF
jgi:hypothetical protein